MVAVLDDYAWREAQALIEQYGDSARGWAMGRAIDLAEGGDSHGVGIWEIIAFAIGELQRAAGA